MNHAVLEPLRIFLLFLSWLGGFWLLRLLASVHKRVTVIGKDLPGRGQVELAELLGQLERLAHDTLDLVVIAHLDKAGEWEVLAEGMAGEAVVGQDATQVGMVREEDAVHVPGLALIPVGALEQRRDRLHGRQLVRVGLDAHAIVKFQREKQVDKLEKENTKMKLVTFAFF